jgi:hypothetical protein
MMLIVLAHLPSSPRRTILSDDPETTVGIGLLANCNLLRMNLDGIATSMVHLKPDEAPTPA